MDPKLETLNAGRRLTARFNDGTTAEVRVRQLPLGDYERAFALLDDEIALTAFCCGLQTPDSRLQTCSRTWAAGGSADLSAKQQAHPGLTPDSYEELYAAAQEVNANGFFAWSARRRAREEQRAAAQIEAMAKLPPEALAEAMKFGASTSPTGSPGSRRR